MTIRTDVKLFLYNTGATYTATDLKHVLNADGTLKLSSLSSILKRMYDAGELLRFEGFGPRGGYGYKLNHEAR